MIEPRFAGLLRARREGILATLRRDGRPQLSSVSYAFDPAAEIIRPGCRFRQRPFVKVT